jgi:hypothetical protein
VLRNRELHGRSAALAAMAVLLAAAYATSAQVAALNAEPVSVNQTSREAAVGAGTVTRIAAALAADPDSDWDRSRVGQLRFARVSLSGAGAHEIFVRSIAPEDCGATGNCPVWVFEQKDGELSLLLTNAVADSIGLIEASGGWRQIALSANQSAETSVVTVYAFNRTRYFPRNCYREEMHAVRRTLAPAACAQSLGGEP